MLTRFVIVSLYSAATFLIYLVIAYHPNGTPHQVTMPSWVPFWPASAPVYLAMLFPAWLFPLLMSRTRTLQQYLIAASIAYSGCILLWIFVPTTMARPTFGTTRWTILYGHIIALDPPTNIFPAAHGVGLMVSSWFLARERPSWRWPLAGAVILSMPTICLTWQHRPVDVLIGCGLAVAGITAANRLRPA